MHDDRELTEARLRRFLRDRLVPAIHRDAQPLSASAWQVPGEPVPFAAAIGQTYEPVSIGWRWGRACGPGRLPPYRLTARPVQGVLLFTLTTTPSTEERR